MSDFLVSLSKVHSGEDLLNLLKKPYGSRAPEGRFFDYPWGSIAVQEQRFVHNKNIITNKAVTFAWVGDLVMDLSAEFLELFIKRIAGLQKRRENNGISLRNDELFEKLNGTFAIVLASDEEFSIVTDPLSFVPVYMGKTKQGDIASFGTHQDLVSVIIGHPASVDVVSAADFLNMGHTTFPYTMYRNVEELKPGSLHCIKPEETSSAQVRDFCYWSPPQELTEGFNVTELSDELARSLISAVIDRCWGGKIGVCLSGGLDSRLIMAAVPEELECIGLTFGDGLNREMKTAQRVCKVYNRQWLPLFRDKNFLEDTLVGMAKLAGCEGDWLHAHAAGFVEKIEEAGIDTLFDGSGIDEFLKGCFTADMARVNRLRGILPAKYVKLEFDYNNIFSAFFESIIKEDVLESIRVRKRAFYNNNLDPTRTSWVERLSTYPISQSPFCLEERRLLPIRTCGADRRILDFGFKCPIELKLGAKIFTMAAKKIYGAGARIPNANDGVRPGSGHWSRLAQRAVRKVQDRTCSVLEKLGQKPHIQHSWHDYQKYWEESDKIVELIQEHGTNLDGFDEKLFKGHGRDLFKCEDLKWPGRFRLLQLAIWKGIVDDYKP
ncbi:MAG: hypothetical protein ACYSTF_01785 [Planctomycetota bacterium]|jgi:asparagine synthetase B (glutamine-hydrolysing)